MALTEKEIDIFNLALDAKAPDEAREIRKQLRGDDDGVRAFNAEFEAVAVPKAQADRDNYLAQAASCDEFIALFE